MTLGGVATALAAAFVLHVPDAGAVKKRKKPPRQELSAPEPDPDAMSEVDDPDASAPVATAPAPDPTPAIPYPTAGLVCFYGQERTDDGKVRCLAPEELDPPRLIWVNSRPLAEQLGMLANTTAPTLPDGGVAEPPEAPVVAEPESPFEARVVRVSFENGVVGGALRSLRDRTDDMAKCVEDEGGLRADSARLKLLFFVRPDRKASGMITASARNIPVPVVRCIRKVIQEGTIGRPSTNPVGVKVLIELKENE